MSADLASEGGVAPLVLASASQRRLDLLMSAGLSVEVIVSAVPEVASPGEPPDAFAARMAHAKGQAVAADLRQRGDLRPVLAADTIVVVDATIFGKPRDRADAARMINALAGREHQVITAFCLLCVDSTASGSVSTRVRFRPLEEEQVERYLARAHWVDKAGAYAIQAEAGALILGIEGSHTNVIGLPLAEVVEHLRRLPGFEELC